MARNIDNRLKELRNRRAGIDRIDRLNDAERVKVIVESANIERWQMRAARLPYTRYALGAKSALITPKSAYTQLSALGIN